MILGFKTSQNYKLYLACFFYAKELLLYKSTFFKNLWRSFKTRQI